MYKHNWSGNSEQYQLTWLPRDESLDLLRPLPRLPGGPGAVAETPAQVGQKHRVSFLRLPDPRSHLKVLMATPDLPQ